ncbi:MAG TPA: DPP IV N-terminal domain-containing protein [Bryobacteraceae bacterium]|jgi:dipeptidyl-peptidase-4|nr:DPP IV N-terminal domain-containing protein [Bryobacteraceae bacterium]
MRAVFWLALFVSVVPAGAKKPITIEELLDYHDASGIAAVWAPDGRSFAFEKDGEVYVYRGSAKPKLWFDRKSLNAGAEDQEPATPFNWRNRRVSSAALQWFPNGQDALVIENHCLFVVHANGKFDSISVPVRAEDPQLAPNGKLILYRSRSDLYVLNVETRKVKRLTENGSETLLNGELDWVYPEELELGTAAWWSPDSTKVAYFQFDISHEFVYPQADLLGERAVSEPERYPQAGTPNALVRLGVVSADGGETTWMKAGNSKDVLLARVAWMPDSSKVALETMPRVQNALDLLLCDPGTGETTTVLHEESKTWINIENNLWWLTKRPEFLWTSERSGFRHIYRYAANGELLGQLTSGEWEVKEIEAVDEDAGRVYYTSSEDTPIETQLASVPLAGGARTRITEPSFSHNVGVGPEGRFFVDRCSNLNTPPETTLRDGQGKQIVRLYARDSKMQSEFEFPHREIVTFKTQDGTALYGRLMKPVGFHAGRKYPLIVEVYGGPGVQVVRNEWPRLDMTQVYASNGYVVWQVDNRGSSGRGHAFEEPIFRNLGSVEVADQLAGVDYLLRQGFVDPNRVGMTGWSYGGYMTIRCLLQAGRVFNVGVAGAPVTDWHNYDTIYTERYMGLPEQNAAAYAASANRNKAGNLEGKLLIQHNFEDDNVLFQNTMQMAQALELAKKQYEMQLYPYKSHGVSEELHQPLYQAMLNFFERNLKGGS